MNSAQPAEYVQTIKNLVFHKNTFRMAIKQININETHILHIVTIAAIE